jgi:hypothetical protein
MVAILPGGSNWDVIGQHLGESVGRALPRAVEQGYQRQQGLGAIDQLQQQLQESGGDINKMLPALARAYTLNPSLERSGLGQTFMQQAKVNRAFPQQGQQPQQGISPQLNQEIPSEQGQISSAVPSPFNVFTGPDIDKASEQYARDINDPSGYGIRQSQLNNLNQIAEQQRANLEDAALKANVAPEDLSRFMIAGSKFDPRNPSRWVEQTKQEFKKVKSNLDQLERSFFPSTGNALLGQNREKALKNLQTPVSNLVKQGYEDDVREQLASNYMSPSEIEETIRPLTPQKIKAIENLPKGSFPAHKTEALDIFSTKPPLKYPIGSYEEAQITHPKELERMKNELSDFFLKNVDKNTALLPLRDKIWEEKDYDWQQFAPAIEEAVQKGLKLTDRQQTEIAEISTQPPRQSLPDIFKSFDRVIQYFRGNK